MDHMRLVDFSQPLLSRLATVHALLYRATDGRIGGRFPGIPPMLLLDHVGARSGIKRTTPLGFVKYAGYQERTAREIPLVVLERDHASTIA